MNLLTEESGSMLEYLARENERLTDMLRRLSDFANAADVRRQDHPAEPSADARRELDELVRDARALLERQAADRPAVEKRLAKLRENRAKRPPK